MRVSVDSRLLSREAGTRIIQKLYSKVSQGEMQVRISSSWNGTLRWTRNRVNVSGDSRAIAIGVIRSIRGEIGTAVTNQTDDVSLEAVVRAAERNAQLNERILVEDMPIEAPDAALLAPSIWSEATYGMTGNVRGQIAHSCIAGALQGKLLSAGYLETRAGAIMVAETTERLRYVKFTQAQCSMTAYDRSTKSSGWAGHSGYDWGAFNSDAIAHRAVDKCIAAKDPVAIEPGRYVTILEPQAVCDFVKLIITDMSAPLSRTSAERGEGPFAFGWDNTVNLYRSRLGLKIIDPRLSLSHDPMDPRLGIIPTPGLRSITWIDRGTLVALNYDREYALSKLNDDTWNVARGSFQLSGGDSTLEDMIATTPRGILISRFSNLSMLDPRTLLATGVTRNGLWLIENGVISKSVKNLRMTDSPLYALNNVSQLGIPVSVFMPSRDPRSNDLTQSVVPAIKVHDLNFTATMDMV